MCQVGMGMLSVVEYCKVCYDVGCWTFELDESEGYLWNGGVWKWNSER